MRYLAPLAALALPCLAQAGDPGWWLMGGGNVGLVGFPSLDYVAERYNETRPWLDAPMGRHRLLRGPAVNAGFTNGFWYQDLGLSFHHSRVSATGSADGTTAERQWDLMSYRLSVSSGVGVPVNNLLFLIGIGAEASIDHRRTRQITDGASTEWERILTPYHTGISIQGGFAFQPTPGVPFGVMVRPRVVLHTRPFDTTADNRALNPSTAFNDPIDSQRSIGYTAILELQVGVLSLRGAQRRRADASTPQPQREARGLEAPPAPDGPIDFTQQPAKPLAVPIQAPQDDQDDQDDQDPERE